jgi:hypothetical protein
MSAGIVLDGTSTGVIRGARDARVVVVRQHER